jgi:hypothetical protein
MPKKPQKTVKKAKKTEKKGVKVIKTTIKTDKRRRKVVKADPIGLFTIPKFQRTGQETIEFKKRQQKVQVLKFFNENDYFSEFNIVEFTNLKRQGLKNTGKYDDKEMSIAYQYEDGTWGGTKFFKMDETIGINRRYGDEIPTDRIIGFVIKFR